MRTVQANRTCDINAEGKIHQAAIVATPEMYRNLYSGLYSRKELAIIREYMSGNAWDGHLRAGTTDTPIDVHMPTYLEPWFEVRDYGIGLSPDGVTRMLNYGETDKNESNDEVGGLGYGAKAGYAYTDQFTVTSYKDGWAYTFQAFLQSSGIPACMEIDRHETDQPNGVLVRVNIADQGDSHERFIQAMRELYPFMPTKPRLNINLEQNGIELPTYRFDRPVNADPLYHVGVTDSRSTITVVQGTVPYSVRMNELFSYFREESNQKVRQIIDRMGFTLWVNIGTFPITVSREGLELDDDNRRRLYNVLRTAALEVYEQFTSQLETASTWHEWAQAAKSVPFNAPTPERFKPMANDQGALRFEDINAGTSATWAECDMSLKDRCRRKRIYHMSVTQLERATLYVMPKSSWPIKRFLTERHFTGSGPFNNAIVMTGDIQEIRKNLKAAGVPNKVHEVEHIKAPANSSQSQRQKLGATEYPHRCTEYVPSVPTWQRDICPPLNAKDFMNLVDGETNTAVVTDSLLFEDLDTLIRTGLVKTGFDRIRYIGVHEKHTRVLKAIREEFSEVLIDSIADKRLQLDRSAVQEAVNKSSVGQKIEGAINFIGLKETKSEVLDEVDNDGRSVLHHLKRTVDELLQLLQESRSNNQDGLMILRRHGFDIPEPHKRVQNRVNQKIELTFQLRDDAIEQVPSLKEPLNRRLSKQRGMTWRQNTAVIRDLANRLPRYNPRNNRKQETQ